MEQEEALRLREVRSPLIRGQAAQGVGRLTAGFGHFQRFRAGWRQRGQGEQGRAPKKQFKKRAFFGDLFEKFEEKGHFWREGEGDKT